MALIVTNAKVKNTDIAIDSVYSRIQFSANMDGKKVAVQLFSGLTKEAVLSGEQVLTNLPQMLYAELNETQNQDLATIHEVAKAKLEELGFGVTIDLA